MMLEDLVREVEDRAPDASPLDRLADASAVSSQLEELADHLLGHFVDRARDAGASWAQIGAGLGVSKQAVQKRFTAGETSLAAFTNRATIAVLKAQNEARDRGAPLTTTQHLVLGLLAEWPGIAGQALESVGVTPDALKRAIEESLAAPAPTSAELRPFSSGLRRTLELARRRGLRMGHSYVGTEHLLLGLVDSDDHPTVDILANLARGEHLAADLMSAVSAALQEWRTVGSRSAGPSGASDG